MDAKYNVFKPSGLRLGERNLCVHVVDPPPSTPSGLQANWLPARRAYSSERGEAPTFIQA